jgi:hypothetical protein
MAVTIRLNLDDSIVAKSLAREISNSLRAF